MCRLGTAGNGRDLEGKITGTTAGKEISLAMKYGRVDRWRRKVSILKRTRIIRRGFEISIDSIDRITAHDQSSNSSTLPRTWRLLLFPSNTILHLGT